MQTFIPGGISKYFIAIASRLPDDLGWFFVISQADELGVPQMIGSSPFKKIDLRYGLWLEPHSIGFDADPKLRK